MELTNNMNTLEPYEFRNEGNLYSFITDNAVVYQLRISDGSTYFNNFPENLTIYDFIISVAVLGGNEKKALDKRIERTVVQILIEFLSEKENSVIYICDDSDNRHHIRKRKYDSWFNLNKNSLIEKHDLNIQYEDFEVLTSLPLIDVIISPGLSPPLKRHFIVYF